MSDGYERAVWSWTQHLRAGGTTPWSDWHGAADPPAGWVAPGAAQLELVRRLAQGGAGAGFAELADLVLGRSGPGRGLAQQPLSWSDVAPRRIGAPAVDPAQVAADELVRLGVGVLVELGLAAPLPAAPKALPRRRLLARTPAFHLAGAPLTTDSVRRELAGLGLLEGGPSARVALLAAPFDQLMAQVWSARVQRGAPVRWRGFVRRCAGRTDLPPAADLPAMARDWAGRVGADRVHVVVPGRHRSPVDLVGEAIGADVPAVRARRRRPPTPVDPADSLQPLSPAGVDLLRRVNAVLGVRMPEDRRGPVRARLARVLVDVGSTQQRLAVPRRLRRWARDRAERMAGELEAGGYPVHGRLPDLVPRPSGGSARPAVDDVLLDLLSAVRVMAAQPDPTKEPA